MALFNLTDISFKAPGSARGPLASLTENSEYASSTLRFPSDIGSSDKAHYMVININEQKKTQFSGQASEKDKPFVIQNRNDNPVLQPLIFQAGAVGADIANALNGVISGASGVPGKIVDTVKSGIDRFTDKVPNPVKEAGSSIGNEIQNLITSATNIGFTRTIRRIKNTIVLYMPNTLLFSESQTYATPNLSGPAALALGAAVSSAQVIKDNPATSIPQNLSPFAAKAIADRFGAPGKAIFAAATGLAANPMMEILYSSPVPRNFQFDFQFSPRDEKEAKEVQDIIDSIRFFQAPEIKEGSGGVFLIPPAEFDISFYYNGKINPNIPPVSTCVLTNVNVNYAPNVFSTYEVPGETSPKLGRTGMPVLIVMQLTFMETEMVYKNSNLLRRPAGIGTSATQRNADISAAYNTAELGRSTIGQDF